MKTSVMPSVVDASLLQELMTEVKETLATGIVFENKVPARRSFGAIDMWNIRRNARTASARMRRGF